MIGHTIIGRCWRATVAVVAGLILLAALGLAAAQIASAASPSPSPGGQTLRVGWVLDPDSMNPWLGAYSPDYVIYHLNYNYLVGWDETFGPRPELATSWQVSPDGKVWTFKLRQDVKWQDGQPLTAKDVAFTYNFIVKNNVLLFYAYTNGIIRAQAVDPYTVKIICARPKANILSNIVPILPEHIWSKIPAEEAKTTFANPAPIIGCGPFQVVKRVKGRFVQLKANKDYWGGAPKIDTLIFQTYTNPDSMAKELKSGALDAAIDVPAAQMAGLTGTGQVTSIKGTSWRFSELGFNCYDSPDSLGNPVLVDTGFRQALSYAVDRDKIASVAFFGAATSAQTLLPPYSAYTWQPPAGEAYTYDPAKANALLDAAGYKMGPNDIRLDKQGKPIDLRLYATTDSPESQTAAKLVAGWFKDVGVKTTLSVLDGGALMERQYNYKGSTFAPDFDMFIWFWTQDPDPSLMLSVPTKMDVGGYSDTSWWTPLYDKLNVAQDSAIDKPTRIQIAQQMQQIIWRDSPYLIFAYPDQLEAYRSDRWQGVVTSPSNVAGFDGSAFGNYCNVDTYRFITAKTASTGGGDGNATAFVVVGIVIAAIVVAAVALIVRRRRGREVEE